MNNLIKLVGVPVDLGVSKLGVEMGPTAIRYAGIFEALKYAGFEFQDIGDLEVVRNFALDQLPIRERQRMQLTEIERVSEELADIVYNAYQNNELPIILGGDHSVSIGSIAGASKAGRTGLLWIDAHPDANTPETTPSGNVHGMSVAISIGYGYKNLVNCAGFSPKLKPEDICIIGAKDIDLGERILLEKEGIRYFTIFDVERIGIANVMEEAAEIVTKNTESVHVSFDVDVLEMQIAPGSGIMAKGGLNYREITYIMEYIGQYIVMKSLDVIEVNPLLDVRNRTAELCVELVALALGSRYSEYEKVYLEENKPINSEGKLSILSNNQRE